MMARYSICGCLPGRPLRSPWQAPSHYQQSLKDPGIPFPSLLRQ
ncbi:MAG: hypothetical protein ABI396_05745 [Ktedonobacteraceae bacterium]